MKELWRTKMMAMAIVFNIIFGFSAAQLPTPNGMSFQQCYVGCFILCAIQPTQTLSSCGFECLKDCLIPQNHNNNNNNHSILANSFHFCNLGCASIHCNNISTPKNPGGKEVASCVGSCSGMCRKNYMVAP